MYAGSYQRVFLCTIYFFKLSESLLARRMLLTLQINSLYNWTFPSIISNIYWLLYGPCCCCSVGKQWNKSWTGSKFNHNPQPSSQPDTNKHTYLHIVFVFTVAAQRNPFKNQRRLIHSEPPLPRHLRLSIQKHPSLALNGSHLHLGCEPSCAKSSCRLTESPSQIVLCAFTSCQHAEEPGSREKRKTKRCLNMTNSLQVEGRVWIPVLTCKMVWLEICSQAAINLFREATPLHHLRRLLPLRTKFTVTTKKGQDNERYTKSRMSCQDNRSDTSV